MRMNVEEEMTVAVSSQIPRFEKPQCATGTLIPLVGNCGFINRKLEYCFFQLNVSFF